MLNELTQKFKHLWIRKKTLVVGIFRSISDNKEIKYITAFSKTVRNELDEPLRMIEVKLNGIPYKENDKIIAIKGIFQDITKKKETSRLLHQYTEELEKKNKELDQFAYVVSHDLNAPLRGINNLSL